MNGRRKFILQMGAIGGALALPANLSLATPKKIFGSEGKKDALKVKVVFVYHQNGEVQNVPDWPNIGYDFRPDMVEMVKSLNAGIPDVEFIPDKAVSEEDALKMVEQDGSEIAGYLVVMFNPWLGAPIGFAKSGKPVLATSLLYGGGGGVLLYSTRIGEMPNYTAIHSLDFSEVVKTASAFSVLRNGSAADFKKKADEIIAGIIPTECSITPKDDVVECLSPEDTLARCKGLKILSVDSMHPNLIKRVKDDLDIDVINVSYDEINKATSEADMQKAAVVAEKWKNEAIAIYDVDDQEILGSARVYVAMKDLLQKYGACAITINCLGACYEHHIPNYPCLGFKALQDEGLLGVCENDINSTISMLVGNIMTKGKRIGYLSDPVLDYSHRAIIYAHCVCTSRFFGTDGPSSRYEILTHSEDRNGASVRTIAPIGYPVTTFSLMVDRRRLVIHTGVITGNSKEDMACRTKIIAEITGDYSKTSKYWETWHRTTFVGDFSKDVVALADRLGYEVLWQS